MSTGNLLLGIDIGTSGVKVGVFDTEGHLMARAVAKYPTIIPQPGWAEQDPVAWWSASQQAVIEVVGQVEAGQIQGISVVGLSPALICVDEEGEVVRPAVIWSDQRAEREIAELTAQLGPFVGFSTLPRALWLYKNEPQDYQRTSSFFESFDYINFMLTGEVASVLLSGGRPPWVAEDISGIGLDAHKFPVRSCQLGEVVGELDPEVARGLGLTAGVPVVAGTVDSFAAWIGTATMNKGEVCNTVGTTDGVAIVWNEPLQDVSGRIQSMPHIIDSSDDNGWIVGGAMSSGGIMLDWFVRRFYDHVADPFQRVNEDAASVTVGADGLIALPYLAGERSPINDPHARAVFFGIGEHHHRQHFARAVLESVALAVCDVCEVIEEAGAEISQVTVAGGAARSDVWSQIKADAIGKPVFVPVVTDSSLLGAAIIAAWGVGIFPNISKGAKTMVKLRACFEPRPEEHAAYTQLLSFYRNLYQHVKEDFAELGHLLQSLRNRK